MVELGLLLNTLEPGIKVSIVEGTDTITELIKMYSGGEAQLSDDLLTRQVDHVLLLGKSYIQIHLTATT